MSDRSSGDPTDSTRAEALQAMQWLREQHPDARMSTKVIPSEEAFVAVRVRFEVSDDLSSSAHGVAMAIEEAEDRGIVRALEALGYRRQPRAEVDADAGGPDAREAIEAEPDEPLTPEPEPEPSPAPAPPEVPTRPQAQPHPAEAPGRPPGQQPAPLAGRAAQMGPPVLVRPRQQPSQPPAQQRPAQGQGRGGLRPVPDLPETDARLEDVSWTEFWKWARARGLDSRDAVNYAIGRPMDGMTPREVRDVLKGYLGEEE